MRFRENGYWQVWLNTESEVEREEQDRVDRLAVFEVYVAIRTKTNLGTDYIYGL